MTFVVASLKISGAFSARAFTAAPFTHRTTFTSIPTAIIHSRTPFREPKRSFRSSFQLHSEQREPSRGTASLSLLSPDNIAKVSSIGKIARLARPERRALLSAISLLVVSSSVSLSIPFTIGKLIDFFASPHPVSGILVPGLDLTYVRSKCLSGFHSRRRHASCWLHSRLERLLMPVALFL